MHIDHNIILLLATTLHIKSDTNLKNFINSINNKKWYKKSTNCIVRLYVSTYKSYSMDGYMAIWDDWLFVKIKKEKVD